MIGERGSSVDCCMVICWEEFMVGNMGGSEP